MRSSGVCKVHEYKVLVLVGEVISPCVLQITERGVHMALTSVFCWYSGDCEYEAMNSWRSEDALTIS